jgi:hypothetical protein
VFKNGIPSNSAGGRPEKLDCRASHDRRLAPTEWQKKIASKSCQKLPFFRLGFAMNHLFLHENGLSHPHDRMPGEKAKNPWNCYFYVRQND